MGTTKYRGRLSILDTVLAILENSWWMNSIWISVFANASNRLEGRLPRPDVIDSNCSSSVPRRRRVENLNCWAVQLERQILETTPVSNGDSPCLEFKKVSGTGESWFVLNLRRADWARLENYKRYEEINWKVKFNDKLQVVCIRNLKIPLKMRLILILLIMYNVFRNVFCMKLLNTQLDITFENPGKDDALANFQDSFSSGPVYFEHYIRSPATFTIKAPLPMIFKGINIKVQPPFSQHLSTEYNSN